MMYDNIIDRKLRKLMTNFEQEVKTGIEFFKLFDAEKIHEFVTQIKPPVLVAAMGSSYYLPSGRAQSIADQLSVMQHIRFIFASEGYNINPKHWNSLILISNSGKTREIISLAKKFKKENIYAITSSGSSELASLARKTYVLQSGKEKAVAATKSIVEQSLVLEDLVKYLSQKGEISKVEMKQVDQAMKKNLNLSIDSRLVLAIAGAQTVYFVGGSTGIGEEVALKFNELAKKKSKFIPGTQILHGSEEVIEKGDVVFLLFAEKYRDYADRFKQMKEKTGCFFVTVGQNWPISDVDARLELVSGYKPYCYLAYFWNILTKYALLRGYSLDKADKIAKVGVGAK